MIANGFPSTNLKQPQSLQILGANPVLCHHEQWQSHLQKVFISHQDSELLKAILNVCHTILYHTKINTTYHNLIKLVSVKWKIWKSNICATNNPKAEVHVIMKRWCVHFVFVAYCKSIQTCLFDQAKQCKHTRTKRRTTTAECSCRSYCSSTLNIPPFRQLWMPTGYSRPMPYALHWGDRQLPKAPGVWQGYMACDRDIYSVTISLTAMKPPGTNPLVHHFCH